MKANPDTMEETRKNADSRRIKTVFAYVHGLDKINSLISRLCSHLVTGTNRMIPIRDTDCSRHWADCMLSRFFTPLIIGMQKRYRSASITLLLNASKKSLFKNPVISLPLIPMTAFPLSFPLINDTGKQ